MDCVDMFASAGYFLNLQNDKSRAVNQGFHPKMDAYEGLGAISDNRDAVYNDPQDIHSIRAEVHDAMQRGHYIPQSTILAIVRMAHANLSKKTIAQRLNVSRRTVSKFWPASVQPIDRRDWSDMAIKIQFDGRKERLVRMRKAMAGNAQAIAELRARGVLYWATAERGNIIA